MGNWRIYWKWFKNKREPWPVSGWFTNNRRLQSLKPGSRLWLLISGEACGQSDGQTYLAEVLRVETIGPNPDYDSDQQPSEENFRFRIDGNHSVEIDPPLLVEDIIFPDGRDLSVHVGMRLQQPIEMESSTVKALEARLKRDNPEQYQSLHQRDQRAESPKGREQAQTLPNLDIARREKPSAKAQRRRKGESEQDRINRLYSGSSHPPVSSPGFAASTIDEFRRSLARPRRKKR